MANTVNFEVIGKISKIEIIAVGNSIREYSRLRRSYGAGRWRKLKGLAKVRFSDATICNAELHWYEAHGIGKKELRIKHVID